MTNLMMKQKTQRKTTTGSKMPLSQKYIDFINATGVFAEFLEGTTASGKTTIGAGVKFMRMVSASSKNFHVIAAKTVGKAETTILGQTNGILDLHTNAVYKGNGTKGLKIPHVEFEGKKIFVLPYGDRSRWEMVLGMQVGCVYVDEINIADIEFCREIIHRCDYFLATCNPDDPHLPVYKEFINRARPFKKYAGDVPAQIAEELKEPMVPGWRYWFFNFRDNLSLTKEQIERKIAASPPGTKSHKNKILGLRGRAEGLVFQCFDTRKHLKSFRDVKDKEKAKEIQFYRFSAGLDTGYSRKTKDLIAMVFVGITTAGEVYVLDELTHDNRLDGAWGPSDVAREYHNFLEKNREDWGFARHVFYDCADAGFAIEWDKFQQQNWTSYEMTPSWKIEILERINLQNQWLNSGYFYVLEHCTGYIGELNAYSWSDKNPGKPEDTNDHIVNACQYAWTAWIQEIGLNNIQN